MNKYKTYVFRERDPIIDKTLRLVGQSKFTEVSKLSGVSAGTYSNWKRGKTKRPQFCTIEATGRAYGMTLDWKPLK